MTDATSRQASGLAGALLRPLPEALLAMAAALLTLACAQWLASGTASAVLAVVLCLSLTRSRLDRDARGRLQAAVELPLVALAAMGVGWLLGTMPWAGAATFTACVALSIWLRQFGEAARRAGRLIALPFVVVLTVPHLHDTAHGPLPAWLVPVAVALLALCWVSVLDAAGRRLSWLPDAREGTMSAAYAPARPGATPAQARAPQALSASTRMAAQMAVALAAAFVAGHLLFGYHWAWVVLTAFIVNSGNRGRLDVVHKSVRRLLGAAAGTALASMIDLHVASGSATAALILTAVFVGTWLRPLNYAWWALCITLALALLQGYLGQPMNGVLWARLEAIVAGAVLGVAAAWFVLPVRSTDVLRRRLADALAALAEAFDAAIATRTPASFIAALDAVDLLAPAFRALRRCTGKRIAVQPADWIDTLHACRAPALALIAASTAPGNVRRTIGAARKALREPAMLGSALDDLRRELLAAAASVV